MVEDRNAIVVGFLIFLSLVFSDYPNNSVYSSMMSVPPSGHGNAIDRIMPVHPDVRLKTLPFYDTVAEILKPSTLSKYFHFTVIYDAQ